MQASIDEYIKTLADLGLNNSQAKIYLSLIKMGPATIRQITHSSKAARPDVYRSITQLQNFGLVEKIIAAPTKYKALSIVDGITILMMQRTKENIDLNKRVNVLIQHFENINFSDKDEESQFVLIHGDDAIEHKLVKLMASAQDCVCVMVPGQRMHQWVDSNYDLLKEKLEKKVNVRVITEQTRDSKLQKLINSLAKLHYFETRFIVGPPSVWFRIYDNQQIIMTTSKVSLADSFAVISNNKSLIELAQNYFDSAWFSAIENQNKAFKHDVRQFDYLFANMVNGFAYSKMIFDDRGKPYDFIVLETNVAFEKISGFDRTILGIRASKILAGSEKNFLELVSTIGQVITSGQSVTFEFYSEKLAKWFSILAYSPEPGYFATIFEDITQRKIAEQEVQDQKDKAERYLRIVGSIILALDIQGKVTLLNKKGYEVLGYKDGELTGKDWVDNCLPSEIRCELRVLHNQWVSGKVSTPEHYENAIVTKHGERRIVRWYNTELRDGNGQLVGTLSSGEDITEYKKAEETLLEKVQLNQTLLDAFPCVALLLRPSTREIVALNRSAVEAGAVLGKTCYSTWARRKNPCPWCMAPELWSTGKTQHKELEALGVFWDAYWVAVTKDLYMHYAFDITERKEHDALKNCKEKL